MNPFPSSTTNILPPSRPTSSASGSTALFEAVDWIIAEQREFIAWWDDAVREDSDPKRNGAGRGKFFFPRTRPRSGPKS